MLKLLGTGIHTRGHVETIVLVLMVEYIVLDHETLSTYISVCSKYQF